MTGQNYPPLKDDSIIRFGKHKGKKLIDVPADYLLWLNDQPHTFPDLKKYIVDNLDALKLEAAKSKGNKPQS